MILVLCGSENKAIHVYQDLIAIHSEYFHKQLDAQTDNDFKISLSHIKPAQFANYVGWLHTRNFSLFFNQDIKDQGEGMWKLGRKLGDERFQNWCMDSIRRYARHCHRRPDGVQWPSLEEAELIYKITAKGSVLRKFVADVLACNNELRKVELQEQWLALLDRHPELSVDIHRAELRDLKGTQPWDAEHRMSYMVP